MVSGNFDDASSLASGRVLPDTPMGRLLELQRKPILECAARYGISRVRVFGSVARGEDNAESDVDIVIDYASGIGLFDLVSLQGQLGELVGRKVDLVLSGGLRPEIRESVEQDAITL
jgi:predicted nucleotidyltransferase